MKNCPSCNRTYADETLSFCLVDGAVLSAPYDLEAGEQEIPTVIRPVSLLSKPKTNWHYFAVPAVVLLLFAIIGGSYLFSEKSENAETNANPKTPPSVNANSLAVATPSASPNKVDDSKAVIPQAIPGITLMKAVKLSDPQLLRTAFSPRMIKVFEERLTWQGVLNEYTNVFRKEFGEYELDDFTYSFEPATEISNEITDEKGVLKLNFKGRKIGGMRVIREAGSLDWKLDER